MKNHSNNKAFKGTSKSYMLALWLLIFVVPVLSFQWFLGRLSTEQAFFAEPDQIANSLEKLDQYRDAMVYENFLSAKTALWNKLELEQTTSEQLKEKIDQLTGASSIFFLFFDKQLKTFKSHIRQPEDIDQRLILPASLFRRQVQYLFNSDYVRKGIISDTDNAERLRNASSMQKLFRTMTPVTILPRRVVKNYSVFLGGELYFVFHEFGGNSDKFCIAVFRGRDLSAGKILKDLSADFPGCRTKTIKNDIKTQFEHPEIFSCGIRKSDNRQIITQTADQRFIRSFITGGGLKLTNSSEVLIPQVEIEVPESQSMLKMRRMISISGFVGNIMVAVSGIFFFYTALFGQIFPGSFKKRILFLTGLAAVFPFALFTTGFYFFSQFNHHLEMLNLFQHTRFQMARIQSELNRYISQIETTISRFTMNLTAEDLSSKNRMQNLLKILGDIVPATHLTINHSDGVEELSYDDRYSEALAKSGSNAVIQYFPRRTLEILQEKQPVARKQNNIFRVAGHEVKTSSISDSLLSDGALFMSDQTRFVSWFSAAKIFEGKTSKDVSALLITRFEAGSLIKSFLENSDLARQGFTSRVGKNEIRFAFFPIENTCSLSIWPGSGHINDSLFKKILNQSGSGSKTSIQKDEAGRSQIIISKINNGVPHQAVASAILENEKANNFALILITIAAYLSLVFFMANRLIDIIVVSPVLEIAASAESVARGKETWSCEISSGDEMEALNDSFKELVKHLQQRNLLRSFVSDAAMKDIESSEGISLVPGGEYCEVSILFASLKLANENQPDFFTKSHLELLNGFLLAAEKAASDNSGQIDKILSTTIMIVFRSGDNQNHALNAVKAAERLAKECRETHECDLFAGIASGKVISGRIGSYRGKLDYTVIGDPVNLAARLKKESEDSGAGIIISGNTMRLLKGRARVRFLKRCQLKGKSREYNIYELLDLRDA